jgi:hypothetical protein
MKISIDPRIELISIIQYLGKYKNRFPILYKGDSTYTEKINNYFSKYRNDRAIKYSDKMGELGFCYDAPYCLILHNKNVDFLELEYELSEYIVTRMRGIDNIKKYINVINDFITKTKYLVFFKNSSDYYMEIINELSPITDNIDCINQLNDYYGYDSNNFNLIFSTLSKGNYGVTISSKNIDQYYCIIGLDGQKHPNYLDQIGIDRLVWHEFGHSYINPLTHKYLVLFQKYEKLFNPIKEKMCQNAYGDWESCINEHLIRAITNKLTKKYYSKECMDNFLKNDLERGFIYLPLIIELFDKYENNRGDYKRIDDFYHEIIAIFKSINN